MARVRRRRGNGRARRAALGMAGGAAPALGASLDLLRLLALARHRRALALDGGAPALQRVARSATAARSWVSAVRSSASTRRSASTASRSASTSRRAPPPRRPPAPPPRAPTPPRSAAAPPAPTGCQRTIAASSPPLSRRAPRGIAPAAAASRARHRRARLVDFCPLLAERRTLRSNELALARERRHRHRRAAAAASASVGPAGAAACGWSSGMYPCDMSASA